MPIQNHWGKGTFATASTPATTTTVKPAMPSNGLGKPSAEACGVIITEPHDRIGLMLHEGTEAGLPRISIFSTVRVPDETSPITPAISTHHALGAGTRVS